MRRKPYNPPVLKPDIDAVREAGGVFSVGDCGLLQDNPPEYHYVRVRVRPGDRWRFLDDRHKASWYGHRYHDEEHAETIAAIVRRSRPVWEVIVQRPGEPLLAAKSRNGNGNHNA